MVLDKSMARIPGSLGIGYGSLCCLPISFMKTYQWTDIKFWYHAKGLLHRPMYTTTDMSSQRMNMWGMVNTDGIKEDMFVYLSAPVSSSASMKWNMYFLLPAL